MKDRKNQIWDNIDSKILCIGYLVLIILRLIGVIRWSWWIILSPLWIAFLIVVLIIAWSFLSNWIEKRREESQQKRNRE